MSKQISLARMKELCPTCAQVMEELGLDSIESDVLADALADLEGEVVEAKEHVKGLPPGQQKHYEDCMKRYSDKSYCASVAWSIYCKHVNPNSEHCKQGEYLEGKGPKKK
jgi:hypothetical protein